MNDNSRLRDPIRQQSAYNPFAMDNWKKELKSQTYENNHQQPNQNYQNNNHQQPNHNYQNNNYQPQNQNYQNNNHQQPNHNYQNNNHQQQNHNQQQHSRHPSDFLNIHNNSQQEVNLLQNEDRFKQYTNKMDKDKERNMHSQRLNQRHYVIPTSINSNYVDFSYKNQNNLKMNKTSQLLNNISSRNRVFDTHVNRRRHIPVPIASLKPINTSDIDITNRKK